MAVMTAIWLSNYIGTHGGDYTGPDSVKACPYQTVRWFSNLASSVSWPKSATESGRVCARTRSAAVSGRLPKYARKLAWLRFGSPTVGVLRVVLVVSLRGTLSQQRRRRQDLSSLTEHCNFLDGMYENTER